MIDSKTLLADLQKQVTLLETDLAEQLVPDSAPAVLLRDEYDAERTARRTAAEWPKWRDAQLTQIAVAWVLGTVFLRWSEDNELIDPVLSGPGDRLATAEDAQLAHYRRHPEHNDGDWLAEQFEVLRNTDAGRLLFDPEHNPMYWVPISHDAAKALVAFWRSPGAGGLLHDFTDDSWGTRFLGDLYQDLSLASREEYSLLQTSPFIEEYILDRVLDPAIDTVGLESVRIVDPACGSGHFLLGSLDRLVTKWRQSGQDIDDFEIVARCLDAVHGVDLNPFAVAISRFRLVVSAWRYLGVRSVDEAAKFKLTPIVACGDSLLPLEDQQPLFDLSPRRQAKFDASDVHKFSEHRLLRRGTYDVVVANPPYHAVDDVGLRERYRELFSACFGKYIIAVPFTELLFELVSDRGFVGEITSSSFMKRRFGKRLIDSYLPSVNLTHIIDTSGIPIPGAGVTTVVLFGRGAQHLTRLTVRVLARLRGESGRAPGPAWRAIVDQTDGLESESEWITATDVERSSLKAHPWTLGSATSNELLRRISQPSTPLDEVTGEVGMTVFAGEDEAFFVIPRGPLGRALAPYSVPVVAGDDVRDYRIDSPDSCVMPDGGRGRPRRLVPDLMQFFWPNRSSLRERVYFGKKMHERGLQWFDLSMLFADRWDRAGRSIVLTAMDTHPHFSLGSEGMLFRQSAPAVVLAEGANRADCAEMLATLNSSTVAFWLRQKCHTYGSGASANGERRATVDWENYLDFASTRIKEIPIPVRGRSARLHRLSLRLCEVASALSDVSTEPFTGVPDSATLRRSSSDYSSLSRVLISLQEEVDWQSYMDYELLADSEAAHVLPPTDSVDGIGLGERAFEILLARDMVRGRTETQWFTRHGSTPITELPAHWSDEYRRTVEARIELIERRRDIALIERPECKRRWASEPWEKQQERALRNWLLDRFESRHLWFAPDANGDEQPAPQTVRSLADQLRGDADVVSVARLWAGDALGRPDAELAEVVGALIGDEHVPFLAVYRYKPSGLAKRAEWEHTWTLQRAEDAIAARMGRDDVTHPEVREAIEKEIGDVPVPPKYASSDFLRVSYWTHRGKLDVPKERFVSYPAASRDGDGSLLLGWAGWDHREQAQALAVLIGQRRGDDGWSGEGVTPLLAGLAEVLPWVHQWHAEVDPVYGAAPGDIYDGFLDAQLGELELSRAALADWRPTGRVDVGPLPRSRASSKSSGESAPRRPRSAPDPEHLDAVLTAAMSGPLSNEQIRDLTGLDTAGARAVAKHLVDDGRLISTGQRRGMRYLLADQAAE